MEEKTSVGRVRQVLEASGLPLQVRNMEETTRTAAEAAAAIGCEVGQIAKSIVFQGKKSGMPFLVIASGANRINERKVAKYFGEALRKPDADYVLEHTGCAIGGIPPVGHIEEIPCLLDEDLFQYAELWAAAGSPFAVFRVTSQQLQELTGGQVVEVK